MVGSSDEGADTGREEIARLLDEMVRLQLLDMRSQHETQKETIIALADAGFGNDRIAELLGTTSATVRSTLHKAGK